MANIQEKITALKAQISAQETYNKALEETGAEQLKLVEANIALAKSQVELRQALLASEPTNKAFAEDLINSSEAVRKLEESLNTLQDTTSASDLVFKELLGSVLQLHGPLGRLQGLIEKKSIAYKGLSSAGNRWFKVGSTVLSLTFKLAQANLDFALRQDKVIANFRASTGAGAEFNEVIRQTERDIYLAGGSFAEAASATGELKNTFTDFTYLNTEMQGELAATTFHLSKLGLSQGTTAGIMQTSTQAMGMSVDQATGFLTDMASTARSLGMDTDKLGQTFLQNKDFFVRFGKDGQQVFEDLAVASKALGAEVGLLVKVMEGFETFDGAATSVGRLNAILGGPFLNSIDMMNASFEDPIEGIKQLRDGFDAAGVSVEDLSGAELKAFSSALGLSTSETKELLGESNEQLDLMKMNQDDLAAAAREAMPIINQLKSVFFALMADFKPLIDSVLIPVAGWLGKMAQGLGEIFGKK